MAMRLAALFLIKGGVLALLSLVPARADKMPAFSWDRIPRYMHVRKSTPFTDRELDYLAEFPLITFEKGTGLKSSGSTEAGTLAAATAVKARNPRARILYYRNILVHYPMYGADEALKELSGVFLRNDEGETRLVRHSLPAYDLSNSDVQEWWLGHAREICKSDVIDGIFVDGNIKALEDGYLRREVGREKKAAVKEGYHRMMSALQRSLPDELVVANMIRARFPDAGLEYLNYFDGSYIENFEAAVGGVAREDYVVQGIEAIQEAARSGKIIAFTIGLGGMKHTKLGIDESRAKITDLAEVKERFNYVLAVFLVCAEKYSYFMPTNGYGADGNSNPLWMQDFPEFDFPLGEPLGPARRDGYVYTRSFRHAQVRVDVKKQQGEVVWLKEP
ncbi:MAG: putative glycoside hydrolase [Verrucomicrobiales bacterium]